MATHTTNLSLHQHNDDPEGTDDLVSTFVDNINSDNLVLDGAVGTGWVVISDTLTYSAAETSPNWGTVTISGDVTTKLAKNRKIKFTQSATVKHGIIMRSEYSSPNTTLKIFLGTDTLANETISDVYMSTSPLPNGWPALSTWILRTTDVTKREQTSPVAGTWYGTGPVSLIIPPGDWVIRYRTDLNVTRSSTSTISGKISMSTSSSDESDERLTEYIVSNDDTVLRKYCGKSAMVELESETTYYIIQKTNHSSMTTIYFGNDMDTVLEAVPSCFRYG